MLSSKGQNYPVIIRNQNCYVINKILVANEDGELAILRESQHLDRLYIPAKKTLPGETIRRAAMRTVREETGIDTFDPKILEVQIEGCWIEIIWEVTITQQELDAQNSLKEVVSWLHPSKFEVYFKNPRANWSRLDRRLMDKMRYPDIVNTIQLATNPNGARAVSPHVQIATQNQAIITLYNSQNQKLKPLTLLWPRQRSNQTIEAVIAAELLKQHRITTKIMSKMCITGVGSSDLPAFQAIVMEVSVQGDWKIPQPNDDVGNWRKARWEDGAKLRARV